MSEKNFFIFALLTIVLTTQNMNPVMGAEDPEDKAPEKNERLRGSIAMPSSGPMGESWRAMPPFVNPNAAALTDRRVRIGSIIELGVTLEVGEADDFDRDIDDLLDRFEDLEERATDIAEIFQQSGTPDLTDFLNDLDSFVTGANDIVDDLTDTAYAKIGAASSMPLLPFSVRSEKLGTFTLTGGGYIEARVAVESTDDAFPLYLTGIAPGDVREFRMDDDVPEIVLTDDQVLRIEPTDRAGVAVQGGLVAGGGLNYSRKIWQNQAGQLLGGTTLNVYHVQLARGGVLFDDDDLEETARDVFDDRESSTALGVDLACLWMGNIYSIGGVLRNINEPSFDYPDTEDSEFFQANPQARRGGSKWTMERQLNLHGAIHTPDKRWSLSAGLDMNRVKDTTGDDYQWVAVLGSFEPRSIWLPSPRLGFRNNLTGERLSYVSAGVSLLRAIHLDLSATLDTTSLDGTNYPRGLQANIAAGWRF